MSRDDVVPAFGTREWYQHIGRAGGKARAKMPDFKQHQSKAGKASARVNDMAALGHLGAKETIRKYGYGFLFQLMRNYQLSNPSEPTRQVMAMLEELGFADYEREAQVLGPDVPVAVDFYFPDRNDAVIEVNGKVHYDPLFDHPNRPGTRAANDARRLQKLERAGFRVLEIDWRELAHKVTVSGKIVMFLVD